MVNFSLYLAIVVSFSRSHFAIPFPCFPLDALFLYVLFKVMVVVLSHIFCCSFCTPLIIDAIFFLTAQAVIWVSLCDHFSCGDQLSPLQSSLLDLGHSWDSSLCSSVWVLFLDTFGRTILPNSKAKAVFRVDNR